MRPLTAALAAAALLATAWSCVNADTEPGPVTATSAAIATYEGRSDEGTPLFSLIPSDDMAAALLSAPGYSGALPEETGRRVMIVYTPVEPGADPYASGTVTLSGCAEINQAPIAVMTPEEDEAEGESGPVWVMSAWRSGQWLNLRLRLPYSSEPRVFKIVCSNPDSPTPTLRLVHRLPEGVEADETFLRQYYASFNMAPVWNLETCRGVTLNLVNANITELSTFTFNKQSL